MKYLFIKKHKILIKFKIKKKANHNIKKMKSQKFKLNYNNKLSLTLLELMINTSLYLIKAF